MAQNWAPCFIREGPVLGYEHLARRPNSGTLSGSGILASQRDTLKGPPTLLRRLLVLSSMGSLGSLDQDLFDIDEFVLYRS